MSEFVNSTLKEMGVAGAAISVLLTAVSGLVAAVVFQWRQANKVYGFRLAERDTLNKALTDNTAAINAMVRATEERNRVTQELAAAIAKQATAFERVNDRLEFYHEDNREKLTDIRKVIEVMSEAVRVNTGMVTDVRNANSGIQRDIVSITQSIQRRRP
jgi:hypothetical protein